jgi:hypothetical protein
MEEPQVIPVNSHVKCVVCGNGGATEYCPVDQGYIHSNCWHPFNDGMGEYLSRLEATRGFVFDYEKCELKEYCSTNVTSCTYGKRFVGVSPGEIRCPHSRGRAEGALNGNSLRN